MFRQFRWNCSHPHLSYFRRLTFPVESAFHSLISRKCLRCKSLAQIKRSQFRVCSEKNIRLRRPDCRRLKSQGLCGWCRLTDTTLYSIGQKPVSLYFSFVCSRQAAYEIHMLSPNLFRNSSKLYNLFQSLNRQNLKYLCMEYCFGLRN